jgi:hypothetical protein
VLIALALILGIAVLLAGAGFAWYLGSRTALVVALALAAVPVASAFAFQSNPSPRGAEIVAIDNSCDAPKLTPQTLSDVDSALAPGVNGDAAVEVEFFADNAYSSRHVVLNLMSAPPPGVRGDAVAFANWKAPRIAEADKAMQALKSSPCRRVGTSIVGAVESANAELTAAGIAGPRNIVLVTNLIEFSSELKIEALRFGPRDVNRAVQTIASLPPALRASLGERVTVTVLFDPRVREGSVETPLADPTAVALQLWATRVFHGVLRAGAVHFEPVSS